MKISKYIILPFFIFLLLRLFFSTEFWNNLHLKARDWYFSVRGQKEISENIVLVTVGDDTFNSLQRQWPFPRSYYAKLIENLQRAGVKEIIFDIEFTEKSETRQDSLLAETIKKYDNIVLAGKIVNISEKHYKKQQILPPRDRFIKAGADWGSVNISSDTDGFVRRYELWQKAGKEKYYSIGVVSLINILNLNEKDLKDTRRYLQIGDTYIPKVSKKSCFLNYYGPAGTFPSYDLANCLDDSTFNLPILDLDIFAEYEKKGVFKDKIVLIGVTAEEFHDLHYTPFFNVKGELTPGVEIHASFIEMCLQKDFIKDYSFIPYLIGFLIAVYLLFALNLTLKPNIGVIVNLLLIGGYGYFCYYSALNNRVLYPVLEVPAAIVFIYIIGLIFQYVKTLQQRIFIKNAFQQYLAPELVDQLLKDPAKLSYGGEEKEITVLFADIRSFTPYTESHSAKETVSILKEYLSEMVDVITRNKGTIDKFVGDEIVAIFGVPVELDNHAYWACKAGFEMIQRLNELKEKWKQERKDPFEIGVGINTGRATVGNLGSEQIFDYTAIGDTINAGARLEAINKEYKTKNHIIISEATYNLVKDKIIAEYLDDVLVKGKSITLKIYQVIGLKQEIKHNNQDNKDL